MKQKESLVVRPEFEVATRYGSYWLNKLVITPLEEKEMPYTDLHATDAVKEKFDEVLKNKEIIYITGTGHGNQVVFTGQDYSILLTKGSDEDAKLMANKWGNFLSCNFGQTAEWWISKGMKGFFGYNRTYYFVIGVFPNSRAHYFFESHHTFDKAVLDKKTWKEATELTKKAYENAIVQAPYDVKRYLKWDMDGIVSVGEMESGPFLPSPKKPSLICRLILWLAKVFKCEIE